MGSIRNNKKYVIPFCVFLLGAILTWGTWVTNGVYSAKADTLTVGKSLEGINKDLGKLQEGQKEMSREIKDNRDLTHKSQKEILEILLNIKKKVEENKKKGY